MDKRASVSGGKPILSFWWLVLVFLAAQVPIGLLAWALHLTFDLPEHSMLGSPSEFVLVYAAFYAKPWTFRQLGRVAAIGVGVGILAMLCIFLVAFLSKVFTVPFYGLMVRLLGTGLVAGAGVWAVLAAYRRLDMPLRYSRQSHP